MGKTAVIFPGQGSQAVGMGREFFDACQRAKTVYTAADDVLEMKLSDLCFDGPDEELQRTDIQQPAIFVTSVAIWESLLERGLPDHFAQAMAGLSLGEYTALHAAGAIGFDDALKLVAQRGKLMQEAALAGPSGMVSVVGGTPEDVQALCDRAAEGQVLGPANYNCPGQIVISGALEACQRAVELASECGVRAIALKVAGAFHSPFMQTAADKLGEALHHAPISRPSAPVLANVSAEHHGGADAIRTSLQQQVTHPVLWAKSIERMIADGFDTFVEIGPGRVLTGLMRKINRQVRAINVSKLADLETVLADAVAS